ncbi:glycosyltransferase family 2 protein [Bacteroides ovatus]|uniref:glycosyltransferase family 2 protein n=1 Tax=Bacteroides ovatus TaxID=28116 RepID=UPI001105F852|nr:glycosyltransferase family 2 protein [Bacteroides ovatus]
MKNENPLISVIIPCYKVEKYLPKCIDSIIEQTYENLEVFLVNDGSPDRCGLICDEYAQKDTRIKVIHKKNGGLSDARNVAIDIAKGEYITFVDSDDYVANDYIESLYKLILKNDAQMSITRCISFLEGAQPVNIRLTKKVKVFNACNALISLFYQKDFDNAAWAKMYHCSLFKSGVRYPKGWLYEDLPTTYRLMMLCNKIVFSSYENYYYLLRRDSIEGAPFKLQKYESCMKIIHQIEEDRKQMHPAIQKSMDCRIVSFAFHILIEIPKEHIEMRMNLFRIIKEYRTRVLFDSCARRKTRIACLLSFGGIFLVSLMANCSKSRK